MHPLVQGKMLILWQNLTDMMKKNSQDALQYFHQNLL